MGPTLSDPVLIYLFFGDSTGDSNLQQSLRTTTLTNSCHPRLLSPYSGAGALAPGDCSDLGWGLGVGEFYKLAGGF